jgi:hypothetical protein
MIINLKGAALTSARKLADDEALCWYVCWWVLVHSVASPVVGLCTAQDHSVHSAQAVPCTSTLG